MEVKDTILYIPAKRDWLPFKAVHAITHPKQVRQPDGKVEVRVVSQEEMNRLWR